MFFHKHNFYSPKNGGGGILNDLALPLSICPSIRKFLILWQGEKFGASMSYGHISKLKS